MSVTDLLRRYGGLGLVARTLAKPAEWWTNLQLHVTYAGTAQACKSAGLRANDQAAFGLVDEPAALLALERSILELNPDFSGMETLRINLAATAYNPEESDELWGYWCFVHAGETLSGRGVFVAQRVRGRRVATGLLSTAAQSISPHATVEASTSALNRAARHMLRRCGLKATRFLWSAVVPLVGKVSRKWRL
jgi:GNAT superfamily N-acetyltransferase